MFKEDVSMELDKIELEKLYKSYGFEVNNDYDDLAIFLYKKGRYFGVDIIPLIDTEEIKLLSEDIKKKYSSNGYAASIKYLHTINEADNELFKSFFSYDATIERLKKKYGDFTKKQTRNLLGSNYEYINTPYESHLSFDEHQEIPFTEKIGSLIKQDGPKLIIIEAAAGYGKTCTAYELLSYIISNEQLKSPIFTELSRNRGAKIFRYILLDEIDIEYPTLNSELVINEIKKGRIPLLIDGFDELLDKIQLDNSNPESFDEIESMLDTIGGLLKGNAKVVLTSRKTAIFSGNEFDSWVEKWGNTFSVDRFSIKEPRIKDWLGITKYNQVIDKNIPIQHIANPVILSYLKNLKTPEFDEQISMPNNLVKQYFDKMLEREKERQNLILTIESQYDIFKNVVKLLLDFDITSETKEFFKEIIKDQNYKLLEYTRTLYSGGDRPTLDNLVDTLATHALLDRKGRDDRQIGFINDFVLGTFIGEIICESTVEKIESDYSYYMIELAATAFRVQSKTKKIELWDKIDKVQHKFQLTSLFFFDTTLKEELTRDFIDLSIYDSSFFGIDFSGKVMTSSAYLNCLFKNCRFQVSQLKGISFVNCIFEYCEIIDAQYIDTTSEVSTIKCSQKGCEILQFEIGEIFSNDLEIPALEQEVLEKFWCMSSSIRSQHLLKLLNSFDKSLQKQVSQSVNSLENRGYLVIRGNHITIAINKIPIVKKILKRA